MDELCVDASLVVKLVLKGERGRAHARQLIADAHMAGARMIAPPLFESEVDGIIENRVYEGFLTLEQAQAMYRALDGVPVTLLHPDGLRRRAREIAASFGQSRVYDSTYAALAELRGCEFWTADRAFYEAVRADLGFVRFLPEYPLP